MLMKLKEKKGELSIQVVLGIALAIIIASFVLIPGIRSFSESVLSSMTTWWETTIKSGIFPSA